MGNCLNVVTGGVDKSVVNAEPEGLPTRILDGALECIARYGVAKTTADDIAKETGCSRATVYRAYPNMNALLYAVVAREVRRLSEAVRASVAPDGTLAHALSATVVAAARHLEQIPALRVVLDHEPEAIMPHLAFERADKVFAYAATLGATVFGPWLEPIAAQRAGELVARLVLSHIASPEAATLSDPETVRMLVCDFVVPSLTKIPTTR